MSLEVNSPFQWQSPDVPEEVKEITIIEAVEALKAILNGEHSEVSLVPSETAGILFIAVPHDGGRDDNIIFLGGGKVMQAISTANMMMLGMILEVGDPPMEGASE